MFRESVGTFRRMSLAEIEDAKPLRLQVVTVAPGDTVEKLATRMAVADRQVERFRMLNGLEAGRAASSPAAKSRSWSNNAAAGNF